MIAQALAPGRYAVPIDSIQIGERLRHGDDEAVQRLAESITDIGLLHPITLTTDGKLVAGWHRLQAHRLLGLSEIDAVVREFDANPDRRALLAELAEIDENYRANSLNYLERAEHLARRVEILRELDQMATDKSTQFVNGRPTVERPEGELTVGDVAQEFGMKRTTAFESLKVAALDKKIRDQLRDTEFAQSRRDLLSLAKADEVDQYAIAELIVSQPEKVRTYNDAVRALHPELFGSDQPKAEEDDEVDWDDSDIGERMKVVRFEGTLYFDVPNPVQRVRGEKDYPREALTRRISVEKTWAVDTRESGEEGRVRIWREVAEEGYRQTPINDWVNIP